ncbi:type II secretion system F family protein [Nesterenkonia alba]|uniref:type II secretion system F family protein n=1 Tax=Nesterenkonia alba TaxID=515814 RepID=UPI0003B35FDB|nr:type II secretion system F family protein [Nesterenkonia alba]
MSPGVLLLVLAGVLVLAVMGVMIFSSGTADQRAVIRAESGGLRGNLRLSVVRPLDRLLQALPVGRRLVTALTEANLRSLYASEYALLGVGVVLAVLTIAMQQVAWFYAVLAGIATGWGLLVLLNRLRERQRQRFVAQLPELARVLANSTNAGMSIKGALEVAEHELRDPAAREIAAVNRELTVGTPLDVALERLEERLPGRDLSVLVSTLVISQRSGGSLISALRGMSVALEARKETAREVKTLMTQSQFTGWMMIAFGVGTVLLFNVFSPGLLHQMTTTIVGQAAILIAAVAYVVGLALISRISKVRV